MKEHLKCLNPWYRFAISSAGNGMGFFLSRRAKTDVPEPDLKQQIFHFTQ